MATDSLLLDRNSRENFLVQHSHFVLLCAGTFCYCFFSNTRIMKLLAALLCASGVVALNESEMQRVGEQIMQHAQELSSSHAPSRFETLDMSQELERRMQQCEQREISENCVETVAHELKHTLFSEAKTRQGKEFLVPSTRDSRVLELMAARELSQFAQSEMLTTLTEEFVTRNSYSDEARRASSYLKRVLAALPGVQIESHKFRDDMSENVVAILPGTKPSLAPIVIGSHYDCRNVNVRDKTGRAPGANDNGTGVAMNLAIASVLARSSHRLERSVEFHFYSGEEQGLFGSRALAKDYKLNGDEVHAAINVDMLGFTADKDGEIKLGVMNQAYAKNLVQFVFDTIQLYMPGLKVDWSPGCCSDNFAWHEHGYDTIGLFESAELATDYPCTLPFHPP
ncbi:MAG: hypothetical protein MHM6MM_005510 [Cercozoa sp. M6MM]